AILGKYFRRELGKLSIGAYADIITIDYEPLTPMNEKNWFGHVLFGMTGRMVNDTVINGRFVMKDRVIQTADTKEILAKSREHVKKIWPLM
ncbi:MAG TPA: chlorohydrolase, partial [Clostridiales bacterium]|nr:chlorohydrolase [Clostridiales bacterium]